MAAYRPVLRPKGIYMLLTASLIVDIDVADNATQFEIQEQAREELRTLLDSGGEIRIELTSYGM